MAGAPGRRGFSMIELLIAATIGAVGVAIAASVVRSAVRQSGQGTQRTQMHDTAQVLSRQLRADFALAGYASTGAIAADCTNPLWAGLCGPTPQAGFSAVAAVSGANNLVGAAVGALAIADGTDVVQLVVPDPSTARTVDQTSPAGRGPLLFRGIPCAIAYIADHSAPNGVGRTQLIQLEPGAANPLSPDNRMFPVLAGAEVMCARVSTYWVDGEGWLRRSDLTPGVAPIVVVPGVTISPAADDADRIAAGVLDFQITYGVSSELTGNRAAGPADRWAWDGEPGGDAVDAALGRADPNARRAAWFEVRQARVELLMRTLRAVDDPGAPIAEAGRLDRGGTIDVPQAYGRQLVRSHAILTNLRMFDRNAPTGLAAEPY
jgi:prepilin-type N-terminal cleavage/methylation domain-containing protein